MNPRIRYSVCKPGTLLYPSRRRTGVYEPTTNDLLEGFIEIDHVKRSPNATRNLLNQEIFYREVFFWDLNDEYIDIALFSVEKKTVMFEFGLCNLLEPE